MGGGGGGREGGRRREGGREGERERGGGGGSRTVKILRGKERERERLTLRSLFPSSSTSYDGHHPFILFLLKRSSVLTSVSAVASWSRLHLSASLTGKGMALRLKSVVPVKEEKGEEKREAGRGRRWGGGEGRREGERGGRGQREGERGGRGQREGERGGRGQREGERGGRGQREGERGGRGQREGEGGKREGHALSSKYRVSVVLTDKVVRVEKVVIPDLHGQYWWKMTLGLSQAIEMILQTDKQTKQTNKQVNCVRVSSQPLTFFLTTTMFSAGRYSKGNTILQLKLPSPSIER